MEGKSERLWQCSQGSDGDVESQRAEIRRKKEKAGTGTLLHQQQSIVPVRCSQRRQAGQWKQRLEGEARRGSSVS